MRREAIAISLSGSSFVILGFLLYGGQVNMTEFLTGVAIFLFGAGFTTLYWGFKPRIDKAITPKTNRVHAEAEAKRRLTRAELKLSEKLGRIFEVGLAGYGGASVLIWIGIQLFPIASQHSSSVPTIVAAIGSGIVLFVVASSSILSILRAK
ncbi:MAG TPA: hypothetical protein VGR53_00700 [Nitrososphaerales archaeon]|nr:hypothetical protein [Nitrososphaerales archaeon]